MRLLLDTHSFWWFVTNQPHLSAAALSLIQDPANDLSLSIASAWEMAIKVNIGKLIIPGPFEHELATQLQRHQIDLLQISLTHLERLTALPRHHRDPFDRLIIAQALSEGLPVVTRDGNFQLYGVQCFF